MQLLDPTASRFGGMFTVVCYHYSWPRRVEGRGVILKCVCVQLSLGILSEELVYLLGLKSGRG